MTLESNTDADTRKRVYQWCYRLLRNHHDALDATQEVLLRSFTRSSTTVENQRAWLRRVTINHCIDLVRKRGPSGPLGASHLDSSSVSGQVADRELHRAIVDGLSRLSDRQRAVLVAKVYDHETFSAIADAMGLSVSSVKTHYLRALDALRVSLRRHVEVEP
jgi:RNA polymerase sigma-70 factor (ECF subfamily)